MIPVICTSIDLGTAANIAWQGKAATAAKRPGRGGVLKKRPGLYRRIDRARSAGATFLDVFDYCASFSTAVSPGDADAFRYWRK